MVRHRVTMSSLIHPVWLLTWIGVRPNDSSVVRMAVAAAYPRASLSFIALRHKCAKRERSRGFEGSNGWIWLSLAVAPLVAASAHKRGSGSGGAREGEPDDRRWSKSRCDRPGEVDLWIWP
jgi:hypothetical protein